MANVFKDEEIKAGNSIVEIVKFSIDVDASGTVRFRSRTGRGSGKAIEIPGEQFDDFVNLMLKTKEVRQSLIEEQNNAAVEANKIITKE